MSEQCERTDERVAQYLRLDSCLIQTTVRHLRVGLNDGEAPHLNPLPPPPGSPALLQASLNESASDGQDTIHSTERLIHV